MRRILPMLLVWIIVFPTLVINAQEDSSSGYRVAEVIDLGVRAGPAGTAAYLSPDGSQYVHFEGRMLCVYNLPDNSTEDCYDIEQIRPHLESGQWSPDSRFFGFVDENVLQTIRDADVQVVDVMDGSLRNVTDDAYEGRLGFLTGSNEDTYDIDVAIAWDDTQRLSILRYPIEGGRENDASIMQVIRLDLATGEMDVLVEEDIEVGLLYLTLAPSGDLLALGRVPRSNDEGLQSIDMYSAETGQLVEAIEVSEFLNFVHELQFSADEQYLLAFNPYYHGARETSFEQTELDGFYVIDLETQDENNLDIDYFIMQAGFAPEGNAVAYVVQTGFLQQGVAGLYIAPAIGEPATLVLQMEMLDGTTPISNVNLMWASNNTIMVRDNESFNALLVVLEETD